MSVQGFTSEVGGFDRYPSARAFPGVSGAVHKPWHQQTALVSMMLWGRLLFFCESVFLMYQYPSAYICCRLLSAHQLHISGCEHWVGEVLVTQESTGIAPSGALSIIFRCTTRYQQQHWRSLRDCCPISRAMMAMRKVSVSFGRAYWEAVEELGETVMQSCGLAPSGLHSKVTKTWGNSKLIRVTAMCSTHLQSIIVYRKKL